MQESKNNILFNANSDVVDITISEYKSEKTVINDTISIIFVTKSSLNIAVQRKNYSLSSGDFIVIPPYYVCEFSGNAAVVASFEIDSSIVNGNFSDYIQMFNSVIFSKRVDKNMVSNIKDVLCEIVRLCICEQRPTLALEFSINVEKLLVILFSYAISSSESKNKAFSSPLSDAVSFIINNYNKKISVRDAAEISGFSLTHFSKLFLEFTGSTFTEFLNNIRLKEAKGLLNKDYTIDYIASKCGFSDYRAFSRAFKNKYNINPRDYKKSVFYKKADESKQSALSKQANDELSLLLSLLSNNFAPQMPIDHVKPANISVNKVKSAFHHSWQNMIGGGLANILLQRDSQQALELVQKTLKFKKVLIEDILGDFMRVIYINSSGKLEYNFDNCDIILDFVLSLGLTPVVQLGFVPSVLLGTNKADVTVIRRGLALGLPESNIKWADFISAFFKHLIERFGNNEVEKWEFHLWGKPDSYPMPFGIENVEKYFDYYSITYKVVKQANPNISFGSPAFLSRSLKDDKWLRKFFALCKKNDCMPDSIRFHFYPVNVFDEERFKSVERQAIQHTDDESAMKNMLCEARSYINNNALPYKSIEIEEWNFSVSPFELLHDTCYMASYIVKTVSECWDKSENICFWAYSDIGTTFQLHNKLFFGGLGLIARNEIVKPSFYAFYLLSKLGDSLIEQGDGYIITKSENSIQLLFYNYCHYSSLFAADKKAYAEESDRYLPFVNQKKKIYSLSLDDLNDEAYLITIRRLNRNYGSSYDSWVKMGATKLTSPDEINYLKGMSQPYLQKRTVNAINNSLKISAELEPFEVQLIELTAVK